MDGVKAFTGLNSLHRWGIAETPLSDTITIKAPSFISGDHLSKHKLLSNVFATFDPLELISPLIIRGKMLIKEA